MLDSAEGWTHIDVSPPPRSVWINLTRKVDDPAYTVRMKFFDHIDTYAHCKDIGYTHWKISDHRR